MLIMNVLCSPDAGDKTNCTGERELGQHDAHESQLRVQYRERSFGDLYRLSDAKRIAEKA